MRIHVKAVVASLLTGLMALAFVSSREWSDGRGRDSVVRITRGALRLDATDAGFHSSDDVEIVLAPPSVVVTSPAMRLDGPEAPALPGVAASFAAPVASHVLTVGPTQARPLVRHVRPSLGRDPPLA